jgi:hypothetical protein
VTKEFRGIVVKDVIEMAFEPKAGHAAVSGIEVLLQQ